MNLDWLWMKREETEVILNILLCIKSYIILFNVDLAAIEKLE